MSKELLDTIEQLEREKNIKNEDLVKMVEAALLAAFRKHLHIIQNLEVSINRQTGDIEAFQKKKVVETVRRPELEMSQEEAEKIKPKIKVNEEIKIPLDTKDFGRIAAQTAKQVIIQRLRETERENLYGEFKKKEQELVNGVIQRVTPRAIIVDLDKVEATLPIREQIRGEEYQSGDRVKVYILRVAQTTKGPQVIISRTHPNLLRRLFELEVPEIYEKIVEIKNVVREPGQRAKVAVVSHNEKVDPVGACVGVKGSRIRTIIEELRGERIDVIPWNEDLAGFITNALSPAKVKKVILDSVGKKAEVVVADDQLSLAIGKAGQNVRLAAKLTGCHIDIKGEQALKKAALEEISQQPLPPVVSAEDNIKILSQLPSVGKKTAQELNDKGFSSLEKIASANMEELTKIDGIGPKKAEKIIAGAKKLLEDSQQHK